MIQTERLTIRIATDEEMQALIAAQTDEDMRQAYTEMWELCRENPAERAWYAVWVTELRSTGERIGDLCFKGLSPEGKTEIGYGFLPEFWGKGYATEAVTALTQWAAKQPGVCRIEAETDPDNAASQRVLEKVGFVRNGKYGEEGPRFVLYRDR